jgi:hypothetical protein
MTASALWRWVYHDFVGCRRDCLFVARRILLVHFRRRHSARSVVAPDPLAVGSYFLECAASGEGQKSDCARCHERGRRGFGQIPLGAEGFTLTCQLQ